MIHMHLYILAYAKITKLQAVKIGADSSAGEELYNMLKTG